MVRVASPPEYCGEGTVAQLPELVDAEGMRLKALLPPLMPRPSSLRLFPNAEITEDVIE